MMAQPFSTRARRSSSRSGVSGTVLSSSMPTRLECIPDALPYSCHLPSSPSAPEAVARVVVDRVQRSAGAQSRSFRSRPQAIVQSVLGDRDSQIRTIGPSFFRGYAFQSVRQSLRRGQVRVLCLNKRAD